MNVEDRETDRRARDVEDRETGRRARDVTGLTLGRIGNTNVAMARTTGQSDAWEGMWKGKTQKQP